VLFGLLPPKPSFSFRVPWLRDLPWGKVWSQKLDEKQGKGILSALKSEIERHEEGHLDNDLAYLADVAIRIRDAHIVDDSLTAVRQQASELLSRAKELYPSVEHIDPQPDQAPAVDNVIAEIEQPRANASDDAGSGDDIPF
jgi:hypothetical protein